MASISGRRESHSGDPVAVRSVIGGLVGELALTNGVPDLDGSVTGRRNDLTVVRREGNRQNVASVASETSSAGSVLELPKTEGLVPGGREGVLTVLRDGNVLDNVVVTLERLLGDTISLLITSQVPHNKALVAGGREQQVGVAGSGSQGGDPAVVALEGAAQHQYFVLAHCRDRCVIDVKS